MFELERPQLTTLRATITGVRVSISRSRWPRLLLTIVVGLAIGLWLNGIYNDATTAQAQWQTEIFGWTATRDLEAGSTLAAGDMAATRLLASGTPRDVTLTDPNGLTLTDSLATGEILRDGRLTSKSGKLAAQIGANAGALTIASDGAPLLVGDLVDLYALIDGRRLATATTVIDVQEGFVTVAITEAEIRAVIISLTTGGVVPVLVS